MAQAAVSLVRGPQARESGVRSAAGGWTGQRVLVRGGALRVLADTFHVSVCLSASCVFVVCSFLFSRFHLAYLAALLFGAHTGGLGVFLLSGRFRR